MTVFNVIIWQRGWVDDLSLSTIAKACLAVIARFMNDRGEAWPALPTIAERASCSRRSAITHLTSAEKRGWISTEIRPGRSTIYIAQTPQPVQEVHYSSAGGALHPCNPCTPEQIATRATGALPVQEVHYSSAIGALPVQEVHYSGAGGAPEATTSTATTSYYTAQEEVVARENFKTENEPESLDAFLMHVAERHGFQISIGQAMAVSGQLLTTLKTQAAVRDYASIRIAEKEGTGIKPGVLMRILAQDAPSWTTNATFTGSGQAPVQTSRLEVRNTDWSNLPEVQAWFDPANHEKI